MLDEIDDWSLADTARSESEVVSVAPTASLSTSKKRRKRPSKQSSDDDPALTVLTGFINQSVKSQQEVLSQNAEKEPEDLLFATNAARLRKLPVQIQSYVKFQISQVFFNT